MQRQNPKKANRLRFSQLSVFQFVGIAGVLASAIIFARSPSWPTPDKLVVFLTFVFMIFGQAWEMLKRIVPFVGLLLVYESFRGLATKLNSQVNFTFMIKADEWLFGQLPTVSLQNVLWHGQVQWYDFLFYLVYMLHFVLPLVLAIVVWKLFDSQYWRYITTFISLSFMGFLTYVLFPAAPPWMASDLNLIPRIERVSSHVWYALGIQDFPSLYNKISPNPVAAVPSLHAAYATLLALWVGYLFKSRWRFLAWLYPALIYVGTVYQGEHYAIDAILGVLYAFAAFYGTRLLYPKAGRAYKITVARFKKRTSPSR